MKIIARHRWVAGAVITESHSDDDELVRFTATIRGWRNWKIYEGGWFKGLAEAVCERFKKIRDAIDRGDQQIFLKDTTI